MRLILTATLMASCFFAASFAEANDVYMREQNVSACLGKPTRVARSRVQLEELVINGFTSRATTFSVKTSLAKYTGDVDTADVVALCYRKGKENVNLMMEQKSPYHTRYHVVLKMDCRICD